MQQLGFLHFWSQGDFITHALAIFLLVMSIASWYVIVSKGMALWQARRCHRLALENFWAAQNLSAAIETIRQDDKTHMLSTLAVTAANAAQLHRENANRGIGAGVSASEFVTRALRNQIAETQTDVESGLTFLASTGSTAPFIGLVGTVWGIYHALIGLAGATTVVLEKVAGPVGEALIMTAGGLFVAIPAVLAFNAFNRHNRRMMARLDGFAHDLHAYLTTGVRSHTDDKQDNVAVYPSRVA